MHQGLIEKVHTINNVCANCYKTSEKTNLVHVGSIEAFVFCSKECALQAMKRKAAN
jgi:endogenous inhibitor of DNA gyrase (YacG/DUF329 family)